MTDLQMPLSLRQGVEMPTERGIAQLYEGIARVLRMTRPPKPAGPGEPALPDERDRGAREDGRWFSNSSSSSTSSFRRLVDSKEKTIPDNAVVESHRRIAANSSAFLDGTRLTWRDIVRQAQKTPDTRAGWASFSARLPRPATTSASVRCRPCSIPMTGSYQPQLVEKGSFVPTARAASTSTSSTPSSRRLSEVQNEFGMLATLLQARPALPL